MKINIKSVLITAFFLVSLLPAVSHAQDISRKNSGIIQEVSLFFTFSKEKKAEKLIEINKNLYNSFNLETNEFSKLDLKNKINKNKEKIKKISSDLSGDIKELINKELALIDLDKKTQIEEIVFFNYEVQDTEVIEEILTENEARNEVSIDKNIAKPTAMSTATSLPIVSTPVEKLTIENLKFTYSPYLVPDNTIRVGEEFKVKLTPNFGTIKDYNIAWISSAYKERYDNGIYSFRFLKTGKYGLAFVAEIKSTGEKKETECSIEVFNAEPKNEPSPLGGRIDDVTDEYNQKIRDIEKQILDRKKQFSDEYYENPPGLTTSQLGARRSELLRDYNSDILSLEIKAEEIRWEYQSLINALQ